MLRERAADDHDAGRALVVGDGECPSLQDMNAHRGEVRRRDRAPVGALALVRWRRREPLERDRAGRVVAGKRQALTAAAAVTPGMFASSADGAREKRALLFGGRVLPFGQVRGNGDDVRRIESGIHVPEIAERGEEKAGADEQDQRERDFSGDEHRESALAARGAPAAASCFSAEPTSNRAACQAGARPNSSRTPPTPPAQMPARARPCRSRARAEVNPPPSSPTGRSATRR